MNEQNVSSQQRNRNCRKEPRRNSKVRNHSNGNEKTHKKGLTEDFK